MKKIKVGLNGFGRIGRAVTRIAMDRNGFEIVAVNTRKTAPDMLSYLLQYDSIYRKYHRPVKALADAIMIGNKKIKATMIAEIKDIPWNKYGVDIVIDATGAFTKKEDLKNHLHGSVKKVSLTAPAKDDMTHVVLGVNDNLVDWKKETIISNASCTTNCAAPMFKVLNDKFKVISGYLTTVHAYTATQSLLDEANKKPDRSRAAALNIGPSTTGAAKAVGKVITELKGKLDGMAVRVPVPTVSFTDISAIVSKEVSAEEVNAAFKKEALGKMKKYLSYNEEQLVSSDFIGSPYSCIFDANYTKVIGGTLVKVFGWYDNEWGYSERIVDLVERVSQFI
jgi:glyceraldehyde 3-phosphate dehydrogenase